MPSRRYRILPLIYWVTVAGLFSFAAWRRFSLPLEQRKLLRRTLTFMARADLPSLAITAILAGVTLFRRDYRRRLGWLAVLTLFVFSYNVAACLEVAVIDSLQFPRYSTVQFTICLFAEFLACWLFLESVLPPIWWGRPIQTSAPGE